MKRFTTSDGLSLAYKDEGTGIPVLCLPGLTRHSGDFDDLAAQIGDEVRLIRLDPRGRGASDWAPEPETYTAPIEARDAVELLDHLGVEKAVIIGTSRGGILSMVLAATVKARLLGVVLNDIGPVIDQVGLDRIADYLGKNPAYAKTYDEAADAMPAVFEDEFPGVSRERWRACATRWFNETQDGLEINYDPKLAEVVAPTFKAAPPDLWPFFAGFDGLPLAVIRGANSDLLSPQTVQEMKHRMPDLMAVDVPDRGHVPFLDEPESLSAIRHVLRSVK